MAGAMTAGAGVTGIRSWLQMHRPSWMNDRHMTWVTRGLLAAGLVVSAVAFGGA